MNSAHLYRNQWLLIHGPIWMAALALFLFLAHRWMPMPPQSITISAGPAGGMYQQYGLKYAQALKTHDIDVRVVESAGTGENLQRLSDPKADVQAAFVQGGYAYGDTSSALNENLETIAQIDVEPVLLLTRIKDLDSLQALRGMRVAIGPVGSGSRMVALRMLEQVRLDPKDLILSDTSLQESTAALRAGKLDAMIFVAPPSAPAIRTLLQSPGIHLAALRRSSALIERMPYLDTRFISAGSLNAAANQPPQDLNVLSTVASLVVRGDLHPMVKRVLTDAALELHSGNGVLHRAGEFPNLKRVDFPSSPQARDVLRNGLPWVESTLSLRWAQWAYRFLLIGLPLVLIALMLSRVMPAYLRWLMESTINRWYGELKYIENDLKSSQPGGLEIARFRTRLREIETNVTRFEAPRSFMQRMYVLKQHVQFVKNQLTSSYGR
jgi:uncharacterized protein